jgi:hypothetical protein
MQHLFMCLTGKDVYWYTREKKEADLPLSQEIRAVKEREEELMMEVTPLLPITVSKHGRNHPQGCSTARTAVLPCRSYQAHYHDSLFLAPRDC